MKILAASFLLLGGMLNAADIDSGKDLFERRCAGCHALDKNKEGPRLRGVVGRAAASVPDFEYSAALKASHLTWDTDTLNRWLTDPEQLAPGNDMAFRVIKPEEREAIIAYLKTQ
ncbi:MAG TPA: c-type cytochrome [Bryobacteraceae bacterium]|nr:c-type cytochrome [Bryobacteraceae bacterium]